MLSVMNDAANAIKFNKLRM